MKALDIPVVAWGPGSQPVDEVDAQLDYLPMPKDMAVYTPPPLPEAQDVAHLRRAKALLLEVCDALAACRTGEMPRICIEVGGDLPDEELNLVNQVLGEGEVSIKLGHPATVLIQESVLTGVWRVRYVGLADCHMRDTIEICDVPPIVAAIADSGAADDLSWPDAPPAGILNAPSVLVEVQDRVCRYREAGAPHTVNLSLLPLSQEDIDYLERVLGMGSALILSRGYGRCRISSTQLKAAWWVQYYNSQDLPIQSMIEIGGVPEIVRAARQDIEDSFDRLKEIVQWIDGDECKV